MTLPITFRRLRRSSILPAALALAALGGAVSPALADSVNVLTSRNDNARTGQNLNERTLTPANVNARQFGPLFTLPVDGYVYAQPLYMSNIAVNGQGDAVNASKKKDKHNTQRNLVFVATEHDSVYAFDADTPGAPVWHASFLNPATGVTSLPATGDTNIAPEIGITSTPVIDPDRGVLYALAVTLETVNGKVNVVQKLHALDIRTGREEGGSPVTIQAAVRGTGAGGDGQTVPFLAAPQLQRTGLLLLNGVVYVAWASNVDRPPYHGWVIGYASHSLAQVAVFNTTPNSGYGGIWQSGVGIAADNDSLYFLTGNALFNADQGGSEYGDSVLKLSADEDNGLAVADYFTPFDQSILNVHDQDLGSGGAVLLPDQPGAHPHLLVAAGKEGKIYLLDRDNLGQYHPGIDDIVQSLPKAVGPMFGAPAYFNHRLYYGGVNDFLKAFSLSPTGNGDSQATLLSLKPTAISAARFSYPGPTPSISASSANSDATGIVWVISNNASKSVQAPAVLQAYAAVSVSQQLYASPPGAIGEYVKFSVPTIANGKVYVGTQTGLTVFGLLPSGS